LLHRNKVCKARRYSQRETERLIFPAKTLISANKNNHTRGDLFFRFRKRFERKEGYLLNGELNGHRQAKLRIGQSEVGQSQNVCGKPNRVTLMTSRNVYIFNGFSTMPH